MSDVLEAIFQRRAVKVFEPVAIPDDGARANPRRGLHGSFQL